MEPVTSSTRAAARGWKLTSPVKRGDILSIDIGGAASAVTEAPIVRVANPSDVTSTS